MTKQELTSLCLKLFGIYVIIQAFLQSQGVSFVLIGSLFDKESYAFDSWGAASSITLLLYFAIMVVFGILLLTKSNRIAAYIFKKDSSAIVTTSLSSKDIQAIAFSVVAVIIFASSLSNLANLIVTLNNMRHFVDQYDFYSKLKDSAQSSALNCFLRIALSLILFFRAQGLVNIWHRIRVGTYEKS